MGSRIFSGAEGGLGRTCDLFKVFVQLTQTSPLSTYNHKTYSGALAILFFHLSLLL